MALVERIVAEVADREDVPPVDLPPLYERLDPEALRELVDSVDDATLEVAFAYDGYTVVVRGDGSVRVERSGPRG